MSMNNISLRPAGAADWGAVHALLEAHQLPTAGAREHLSTYVLAVSNGEGVGCAGVGAEVHGDVALLRSVAVAPGLQRRGLGQALVGTLIEEARRRQLRALYLLTVTAADYFGRHGFQRVAASQVPRVLKASAEFQGACPASAAPMALALREATPAQPLRELPVAVIGAGPVGLVAAAIAGDMEAADRVGLDLPETGVCSAGPDLADAGGCCGESAQPASTESSESAETAACCALDAQRTAVGEAGCGEPAPAAAAPAQPAPCCSTPVREQIRVAPRCCG